MEDNLGSTNPGTICVAQETLGLRCSGFSPEFLLLVPTFSLLISPPFLTEQLQRDEKAPLPLCTLKYKALIFGIKF